MASRFPPRRGLSRDRRKSLKAIEQESLREVADAPKATARVPGKKASEAQKKALGSKRIEKVVEPVVEDFFEDVANTVENKGPITQQPSATLVPVDQIGVVPIRENGKRMLKYLYNGHTRWVELPSPRYGRSLGDILPAEIQREPWMELVRHPLTWDGIERKWLKVGPTSLVFEHMPKTVTPNWKTSVESVGMHWLEDYPVTERPPYQMSLLFRIAILGSPYQTLGSYDIVEILMAKFPWYNANRYRERTSTSTIQRSRDLNAYWVDQISNMSSKSTNRTWLDKHPFLARMTRGAKGHFWRLQDVPPYRISAGRLPVYAVIALPPGTVIQPASAPATHEIKEIEMARIWDRDSQSPSIVDSVEMFEVQEVKSRPVITGSYSVEQNSSGEDEAPDEEDEDLQFQSHVPLYAVYKGTISTPQMVQNHSKNPDTTFNGMKVAKEPSRPLGVEMAVSSASTIAKEVTNWVTSVAAEGAEQPSGVGSKHRREDLLMELVEFALEMDTRRPRKQDINPPVRCASETVIPQATPEVERGTLRRTNSTTEKQNLSNSRAEGTGAVFAMGDSHLL